MRVDVSVSVIVREFEVNKDKERVEAVERTCEVGPSNQLSLFTDMLGDPICRVRHSPSYLMLVYIHKNHSFSLFYYLHSSLYYVCALFLIRVNWLFCFVTDQRYDTLCSWFQQVAEIDKEIVGMIRGCIKTVTCGKNLSRSKTSVTKHIPIYTKLAYILGLRVSPNQRYATNISNVYATLFELYLRDNVDVIHSFY